MSRFNPHTASAGVYVATELWVSKCLIGDGSILSNADRLWTLENFDDLDRLFVQNLEEGEGNFLEKLQTQLSSGAPDARCLMAESLWVLLLFPDNISVAKKRETVQTIWQWSSRPLDLEQSALTEGALSGIGSGGVGYNTNRWRELAYFITMMRAFKKRSEQERRDLLADPWIFSRWIAGVPQEGNRQLRHMLRHVVFPDTFERIASGGDKIAILAALTGQPQKLVRQWDDEKIDRQLGELRRKLEAELGTAIDFYQDGILERWRGAGPKAWLLAWNPENWTWTSLASDRRQTARGEQVIQQWRCVSSHPREGDHAYLIRTGSPPRGIVAKGTVVRAPYDAPHYDPAKADAGEQAQFIDVAFTTVRDATLDPIIATEDLIAQDPSQKWTPQGSGIEIKPGAAKTLARLWDALPPVRVTAEAQAEVAVVPQDLPLVSQAARNLILYGPPGTGKTHRLLTSFLPSYADASSPAGQGRYEFVTFHQSYSYEDFVEGIRPVVTTAGMVTYEVKAGVFRRLSDRAKGEPGRRFAIFIDEINRGNVAKIFGELITLIESDKRARFDPHSGTWQGPEVTLPYSGKRFSVPSNLDVIGTMNTADRSISLLDTALRRRFEFEELMPTPGAILGATGDGTIPDGEGGQIDLRGLLDAMNRRIAHLIHRDQTIGHAYLMKVKDFASLKRIMVREVIPLLQEYFYDNWQRIRLVLADQTVQGEHQLVRESIIAGTSLFPGDVDGVSDAVHYSVAAEFEITPDAIRKIYDTP